MVGCNLWSQLLNDENTYSYLILVRKNKIIFGRQILRKRVIQLPEELIIVLVIYIYIYIYVKEPT